jgi:hypothetical protein
VQAHRVETSRLTHFLHNRLRDGGEVVSLTRRPPFTPRKIPGTHLCWRPSRPQGHSAAERFRPTEKKKKSNDLIGNRTHGPSPCSIVPQLKPGDPVNAAKPQSRITSRNNRHNYNNTSAAMTAQRVTDVYSSFLRYRLQLFQVQMAIRCCSR